jgi:hypothetical protein
MAAHHKGADLPKFALLTITATPQTRPMRPPSGVERLAQPLQRLSTEIVFNIRTPPGAARDPLATTVPGGVIFSAAEKKINRRPSTAAIRPNRTARPFYPPVKGLC